MFGIDFRLSGSTFRESGFRISQIWVSRLEKITTLGGTIYIDVVENHFCELGKPLEQEKCSESIIISWDRVLFSESSLAILGSTLSQSGSRWDDNKYVGLRNPIAGDWERK